MKLELVPPGCHRRNASEVAIRNFKAHFLSVLAGVADDFPLRCGIASSHKLRSRSICFANRMQHQLFLCMLIFSDLLTKTRCHWIQWDARHKYTRRPTSAARGNIIPSMVGTYLRLRITTAHISVISRVRGASASLILYTSSTRTTRIHKSAMPTK
jgi:hypothetical protein